MYILYVLLCTLCTVLLCTLFTVLIMYPVYNTNMYTEYSTNMYPVYSTNMYPVYSTNMYTVYCRWNCRKQQAFNTGPWSVQEMKGTPLYSVQTLTWFLNVQFCSR